MDSMADGRPVQRYIPPHARGGTPRDWRATMRPLSPITPTAQPPVHSGPPILQPYSQPGSGPTGTGGNVSRSQPQPVAPNHPMNWQGPYQHINNDPVVHIPDPVSNIPGYRRVMHFYPNVPGLAWGDRPTYTDPNRTRDTFSLGEVILRPNHEPNTSARNKRLTGYETEKEKEENYITETRLDNHLGNRNSKLKSHVYSKERMLVIIHKYRDSLFCLPLYTHNNKGFNAVHKSRYYENVGVRDAMCRMDFIARGVNPPIDFYGRAPRKDEALKPTATIDMAKGTWVSWREEGIEILGRTTEEGFSRLMRYYHSMVDRARAEEEPQLTWQPPRDGWVEPVFAPPASDLRS